MKKLCIALLIAAMLLPVTTLASDVVLPLPTIVTAEDQEALALLEKAYNTDSPEEQQELAREAAALAPENAEVLMLAVQILSFYDEDGQGAQECERLLRQALACAEEGEQRKTAMQMLAEQLIYSDRTEEAVTLVEAASSENPQDESLRITLAMVLFYNAENDRAIKLLEDLVEDSPENLEALRLRAAILLEECRFDEAETAYGQIAERFPEYLDGQIGVYLTYAASGQFAKATRMIDELLRMGGDESLWNERARIRLYRMLDPNKAFREAEAIIRANPDNLDAYATAIGAFIMMEDYQKALDMADAVAAKDPEYGLLLLSLVAFSEGRITEAERLQRSVVERKPDYVFAFSCLAETLLEGKNDDAGALAALAGAFALTGDAGNPILFQLLGGVYRAQMRQEDAARAFVQANALAFDDPSYLLSLFFLFLDAGREQQMIDTLGEMERKYPGWYETMLACVAAEDAMGNAEEALAVYQALKEKFPYQAAKLVGVEGALMATAGQREGVELIENWIELKETEKAEDYVDLATALFMLYEDAAAEAALAKAEALLEPEVLAGKRAARATMGLVYACRAEIRLRDNDLEGCVEALTEAVAYGFVPTSLALVGDFSRILETPEGEALLAPFSLPSEAWDISVQPEIPRLEEIP